MFRVLLCIVIGATSLSADAPTPCASAFLSTPCQMAATTLTTTSCVPVRVALPCLSTGTTTPCVARRVTATPLPCPLTGTTPCVARTVTTTPLPCPSTMTTTPCAVGVIQTSVSLPCYSTSQNPCPIAASTTPLVPCFSSSARPCPPVASTVTTTPRVRAELAQVGALAVAGSSETPKRDHSASSLPHSKLTLPRPARETNKVRTNDIETTSITTTTTSTRSTKTTIIESTSTTSRTISPSTTPPNTSSPTLTTNSSLIDMATNNSNAANSVGGLVISGASMQAKSVLSRSHSFRHVRNNLRSKENEGTHASGSDKSLMLVLAVALLFLLLFVLVPCWYNCHRSHDKVTPESARGNEEAPLLADDVVETRKLEIAPQSPRELASLVSPSHYVEESADIPEVLADVAPPMSDLFQTQVEDTTDVTAEREPERPIAVGALEDTSNSSNAPKNVSPSSNRRCEIPPVGEAPKNSGCCACRGRH